MKKKILLMVSLLLIIFPFSNVRAYDDELREHKEIIEEVNKMYDTSFYLMTQSDFYDSHLDQLLNKNYDEYLLDIQNTNLSTFKEELINLANDSKDETINATLSPNTKSSLGSKTVLFFSGHNSMTLRYKYSGSKFDTSYKPTVTVNRITTSIFFDMDSHTGKFKNSNSTYSVTAYGKIVSVTGVAGNKSFTVNFNL